MLLLLVHCKILLKCLLPLLKQYYVAHHISLFRRQFTVETRSNWEKLVWQFGKIHHEIVKFIMKFILQLWQTYFAFFNYSITFVKIGKVCLSKLPNQFVFETNLFDNFDKDTLKLFWQIHFAIWPFPLCVVSLPVGVEMRSNWDNFMSLAMFTPLWVRFKFQIEKILNLM